ncbi:MAG: hypothetical protein OXC91_11585, partial [Rhodobacteraceae bacterium]|nr:hypothetical protein [Paracoccaceae bacterium]
RDVAKDIEASASARDLGLDAFDNVAKRVGSTLGKGPTGIAATGAAATAANMIMNPGKPAGTESVMQEGDHEKVEGRKGVRAADSSQSTTMKPDHDQKHAGPRNDPMSSGAEPPDVTATSANERAS